MDIINATKTGVIGNGGFKDYTGKDGKVRSRVDIAVHPKKDQTVWYTVFCSKQTAEFIQETCGYVPGDTIVVHGTMSSYKEVMDGEYKKTMLDTTISAISIEPGRKKLAKPSEMAQQPQQAAPAAQPPQQTAPPPQQPQPQQVQMQPPQADIQDYAQAKVAAAEISDEDLPI